MSSVEFWFEDDNTRSNEEQSSFLAILRRRRHLRDASNPLELEEILFVKNFRLSKTAFLYILREIEGKFMPAKRSTSVPNVIRLATVLRLCAHGSYQIGIVNKHTIGLAQSTVSLIMKDTFNILENFICPKWIRYEYSDTEKVRAKAFFFERSGIPGVIGCVDGTHIKIASPKKEFQHAYYNRKGFYSLNALLVCDDKMKIRFFNAKYPGSSHDSSVFNMSSLKLKLEQQYQSGETNTWLLGDGGYALKPYLMTPFRNPDPASIQGFFNKKHAKARNIVERTIGVLKNRFRCMLRARELHYSPKKATQIANVCAALHNICIEFNIPAPEESVEDGNDNGDEISEEAENFNVTTDNNQAAVEIRNRILRTL